jgi:hypothetical protein
MVYYARYEVFTTAAVKITAVCGVTQCSLFGVGGRILIACKCLPVYAALQPKIQQSLCN